MSCFDRDWDDKFRDIYDDFEERQRELLWRTNTTGIYIPTKPNIVFVTKYGIRTLRYDSNFESSVVLGRRHDSSEIVASFTIENIERGHVLFEFKARINQKLDIARYVPLIPRDSMSVTQFNYFLSEMISKEQDRWIDKGIMVKEIMHDGFEATV